MAHKIDAFTRNERALKRMKPEARAELCRRILIEMIERDNDTARRAADSVLSADYWRDVRAIAAEFPRAVKDGYVKDQESADTWLHESCEGHMRVIYTRMAAESLSYSDHADAMEEETGERGTAEQQCYYAMRADVAAHLAAQGIDLNDPCPAGEE